MDMLGISDLAERYSVSRQAVHAWYRKGRLPKPRALISARTVRETPGWTLAQIEKWEADGKAPEGARVG